MYVCVCVCVSLSSHSANGEYEMFAHIDNMSAQRKDVLIDGIQTAVFYIVRQQSCRHQRHITI